MNHSHANSFLFSMILFFAVFHIWFKKLIRNRKSRYIHNQKAFGFRKSSTLSWKEWALKVSISEKETTLMGPESVYIRKRDDPNGPWKCVYQKKGRPIATPSSLLWGRWGEKLNPKVIYRDTLYFEINRFMMYFNRIYLLEI